MFLIDWYIIFPSTKENSGKAQPCLLESREVMRNCVEPFHCRLVEKHSGNDFFQNVCFQPLLKMILSIYQGPLQWMSLLQKVMYNSKSEIWMPNFSNYRGQNDTYTLSHTHNFTHTHKLGHPASKHILSEFAEKGHLSYFLTDSNCCIFVIFPISLNIIRGKERLKSPVLLMSLHYAWS